MYFSDYIDYYMIKTIVFFFFSFYVHLKKKKISFLIAISFLINLNESFRIIRQ